MSTYSNFCTILNVILAVKICIEYKFLMNTSKKRISQTDIGRKFQILEYNFKSTIYKRSFQCFFSSPMYRVGPSNEVSVDFSN